MTKISNWRFTGEMLCTSQSGEINNSVDVNIAYPA